MCIYIYVYTEICVCVYIYTHIVDYYSTTKKNEILPLSATWMNPEIVVLREERQRKMNIICYHLYMESKNNDTKNLYTKQK